MSEQLVEGSSLFCLPSTTRHALKTINEAKGFRKKKTEANFFSNGLV
jgi:hypothetical protein